MQSPIKHAQKFDVELDFALPDVMAVIAEGGRTENAADQVRSDYFDTADHALLAADMTLSRRSGGSDAGWQLVTSQLSNGETIRPELTEGQLGDAENSEVPAELGRLVVGVSRGQPVAQIASVRTERSATLLSDATGRQVAEIVDTIVHASAAGESATISTWREVELTVGEDETDLYGALSERFHAAGARDSAGASTLTRALPEPTAASSPEQPLTAGAVVGAYVADQQQAILTGDVALRRGDDGVIHKTRVATRRLRSTLRVYGALFDSARAAHLDGELRWYAGVLGEVRDRQVLRKRLDAMLDNLDVTLQFGPVRNRVDGKLRAEQAEHWKSLQRDITGARYLGLLADINAWVLDPPVTPRAAEPGEWMTELVADAERRVAQRLRHANKTGDIEELHDARKAAKRARYAAEAAEPVIGADAASTHADRYQQLQDLLGEHQDSQVSAELLRRLGAKAGETPGENGFTFGILHEREQRAAQAARAKARRTARKYR